MKKLILSFAAAMFAMPALAEDLTFVIPGGTKGLYMTQAVGHTEDFARLGYKTDIGAPGNPCGAAELVNSNNHPTLFVWGSDYEASARMGEGCFAPNFTAEDVVAVGYHPVFVCTTDANIDPLNGEYKIGVWLAAESIHVAAVKRLNELAGSALTPIPYDGSGSALTALTNGEIDVALLPKSRAATVKESGGACKYMFANPDQDTDAKSLVELHNDSTLNLTTMDVIVAKNWDAAKEKIAEIYNDSSSSVNQNTSRYNNNVPDNVLELWNSAVEAFVIK